MTRDSSVTSILWQEVRGASQASVFNHIGLKASQHLPVYREVQAAAANGIGTPMWRATMGELRQLGKETGVEWYRTDGK